MRSKTPSLRAVGPDDSPPSRKHKLTILEAVEAGDRLAEMEATHRRVAKAVMDEETPARDLAALTKRQLDISKEIESLRRQQAEEEGDSVTHNEEWSEEAI